MTIYKKDGSIYKFSAPNKIMLQQDLWKNYKTYNMKLLANCSIIDKNEQNLNDEEGIPELINLYYDSEFDHNKNTFTKMWFLAIILQLLISDFWKIPLQKCGF
jgi:hypothetical protein